MVWLVRMSAIETQDNNTIVIAAHTIYTYNTVGSLHGLGQIYRKMITYAVSVSAFSTLSNNTRSRNTSSIGNMHAHGISNKISTILNRNSLDITGDSHVLKMTDTNEIDNSVTTLNISK